MADNRLNNFTSLDFDQNRDSLKQFLQNQDQLSDYDFDGSTMSVIIDLLAFASQHYAFLGNMAASEKMLSLAQRRISVVENAKNQGYTTRSARSAKANISFSVVANDDYNENTISIPAYTRFNSKIGEETFTFMNDQDYIAEKSDSENYVVNNMDIFEGKKFTFTKTISADEKTVIIPNEGCDTNRLTVTVKQTADSDGVEFRPYENLTDIKSDSPVYFVEEVENQLYQIRFGDGVLGQNVMNGNVVTITYFVSSGTEPNGARNFSLVGNPDNVSQIKNVVVNQAAFNGADIEDIDSVRLRGPRNFERQNRVVTPPDYEDIIKDVFPNIKDVNAWGGEDNDPPMYGTVVVSVIPTEGETITDVQRDQIKQRIEKQYGFLSMNSLVVNPSYLYLVPNITVNYDSTKQNPGANNLKSKVRKIVTNFSDNKLERFETVFRYSRFSGEIDDSDSSIVSNIIALQFYYEPPQISDIRINEGFNFNAAVMPNSFYTPKFTYRNNDSTVMRDNGNGGIDLLTLNASGNVSSTVMKNIGTVDYVTGKISIDFRLFIADDVELDTNERLQFYATPKLNDVTPILNQVLTIRTSDISIAIRDVISGKVT